MFRSFILAATLCAIAGANPTAPEATPATILEVDVENIVSYSSDVFEASKFATDQSLTPRSGQKLWLYHGSGRHRGSEQ